MRITRTRQAKRSAPEDGSATIALPYDVGSEIGKPRNGPAQGVTVFFRSPLDRTRPATAHEISPDSHGDAHVRILHFRAHKAHPGHSQPGAARPRQSGTHCRRLKKIVFSPHGVRFTHVVPFYSIFIVLVPTYSQTQRNQPFVITAEMKRTPITKYRIKILERISRPHIKLEDSFIVLLLTGFYAVRLQLGYAQQFILCVI